MFVNVCTCLYMFVNVRACLCTCFPAAAYSTFRLRIFTFPRCRLQRAVGSAYWMAPEMMKGWSCIIHPTLFDLLRDDTPQDVPMGKVDSRRKRFLSAHLLPFPTLWSLKCAFLGVLQGSYAPQESMYCVWALYHACSVRIGCLQDLLLKSQSRARGISTNHIFFRQPILSHGGGGGGVNSGALLFPSE